MRAALRRAWIRLQLYIVQIDLAALTAARDELPIAIDRRTGEEAALLIELNEALKS